MKNKILMSLKNKTIFINLLVQLFISAILLVLLNKLAISTFTSMKQESTRAIIEGQTKELSFALSSPIGAALEISKNKAVLGYMTGDESVKEKDILTIFENISIGREYNNVYLMDAKGDVVLSVDPIFLNNNFSYRDYFALAMTGKPHMQIAFGVLTHKPGYYFSAPIYNDKQIVGVVAIKVDTIYIDKLFENSSTKVIGHYFLTDENGVVISTDKEMDPYQSLGKIPAEKVKKFSDERRFEGFEIKPLQYQVAQDVVDNYKGPVSLEYMDMEDGEEEEGELELLQVEQVANYPFYLVTESSLNSIFGPISSLIWPIALLLGGAMLVVFLTQYFLYKRIFTPLSKLESFTKDIVDQKQVEMISLKTGDEIESLTASVGKMVQALKESQSQLEVLVQEKTKELSSSVEQLGTKNAQMSQNEIAMLNILEDSKELEKQLEIEKKGVEIKVVERTKQLNDEQAKLLASISALPGAFVIVDPKYQILSQNGRLDDILGVRESEWSLEKIDTLLGDSFELRDKFKKVLEEKKIFDVNELGYGARFLQLYFAPVLNSNNELIGAVLTINDVTEQKVLERSKDEFFSIASHELRTPLTAIRGNTSMIMDYYKEIMKDNELKEMITDTHDASVRLIGIVNDFLDVSRLEQGKMEYKLAETELNPIIEKILKDFNENANKEGVELKLEAEEKTMANVDPGKFEQVMINMIGNAIKFTNKGAIGVVMATKGDKVNIQIEDTGIGIPIKNQALLFRKFQQAGSSLITRDGAKGTGLGLYIARLMTEGMGGKLSLISSTEGKGSIFGIELPVKKE
jgi:signal transduction histidine kinase/HAMP domain-containing protein